MNCKQINQIPFSLILKKIGAKPMRKTDKEEWYISPFRTENKASFKINLYHNTFFDFGNGYKGTVIDFWCIYKSCDVRVAIREISAIFSFHEQLPLVELPLKNKGVIQKTSHILISTISPLTNRILKDYLIKERGLSEYVYACVKEVHFEVKGKKNFSIGFMNDKGGYELRNKLFKGCTSKALTSIKGDCNNPIYVFEGFFDFLSFCEIAKRSGIDILSEMKDFNFLVLNSISLLVDAILMLKKYQEIRLFLDNDNAGALSTLKIKKAIPRSQDYSDLYKPYKDLNDFLVSCSSDNDSFRSFISRCAIVRTETDVQSRNGNLAFTPEGRKRGETISIEIVSKRKIVEENDESVFRKKGRCR